MLTLRPPAAALTFTAMLLVGQMSGFAWSNRGHRMINLVAAQSFPADMPAFMRTPQAVQEISYLGPEPDRWNQRGLEPELISATSPDHLMRLELAEQVGPLPRKRYDFLKKLDELRQQHPDDKANLTPQKIGTLPWEAEEIFERLQAAFHTYRIAMGQYPPGEYANWWGPITKDDLPDIQATAIFYAGWLGHYIGDGCMPLHTSINVAGWALKDNPNGYTRNPGIHHELEQVADDAIEQGGITAGAIRPLVQPTQQLGDPFVAVLEYLKRENGYTEDVYRLEKQGKLSPAVPETTGFINARMAEGAAMLRDLIVTAWIDSASLTPPTREPETNALNR